jgi:hypothetical protein
MHIETSARLQWPHQTSQKRIFQTPTNASYSAYLGDTRPLDKADLFQPQAVFV